MQLTIPVLGDSVKVLGFLLVADLQDERNNVQENYSAHSLKERGVPYLLAGCDSPYFQAGPERR